MFFLITKFGAIKLKKWMTNKILEILLELPFQVRLLRISQWLSTFICIYVLWSDWLELPSSVSQRAYPQLINIWFSLLLLLFFQGQICILYQCVSTCRNIIVLKNVDSAFVVCIYLDTQLAFRVVNYLFSRTYMVYVVSLPDLSLYIKSESSFFRTHIHFCAI